MAWRYYTYTNYILPDSNSVIREVAKKLNLECYPYDYYSIDAVFYLQEDKVPGTDSHTYWFRSIRVAFEHENNFRSGLYQEVSHLLITECDLRVLVAYPDIEDPSEELGYLHNVISGCTRSNSISEEGSFLIIFGYKIEGVQWQGYIYKQDRWEKIENLK